MDYDVVTYGDLVVDVVLPIPQLPLRPNEAQLAHAMFIEPGGMGNFLILASRLGLKAAPLGVLGDDVYAQQIRAKLENEGVDTSAVAVVGGQQTTLALVFMSDSGEHVFVGVLGTVGMTPTVQAASLKKLLAARAFYTNGYAFLDAQPPHLVLEAMQFARQAGVPVYFDPGPQVHPVEAGLMSGAIALADTLCLTSEEAAAFVGDLSPARAAQALLARGPTLVAIKLGPAGCLLATRTEQVTVAGFAVEVADTAGAGDAFDAACVYGRLRGLPLEQIGQLANAAGAATVSKVGTGTRLPGKAEIVKLLTQASIDLLL
jgi:sugar/nucleoside kinase (ribokinase family)